MSPDTAQYLGPLCNHTQGPSVNIIVFLDNWILGLEFDIFAQRGLSYSGRQSLK